ncbi:MAG TPA: hypothetical protein VGX78_04945 [Pirellulales bacterium]|jgi:hypothetical protein|nr:hypothetical protein [Pirellulales bacterium]
MSYYSPKQRRRGTPRPPRYGSFAYGIAPEPAPELTLAEASELARVTPKTIRGAARPGWPLPPLADLGDGARGWRGDDVATVKAWCHAIAHPKRLYVHHQEI